MIDASRLGTATPIARRAGCAQASKREGTQPNDPRSVKLENYEISLLNRKPWVIMAEIIRDSVEGIVWAVPSGSEGAPVEGGGARQDNRLFLDGPVGVCYCFSELVARPARRFTWPGWRLRFRRNEKRVKSLKTNNCAKWSISLPQ